MGLLGRKGARSITTHYDEEGVPDGIQFMLILEGLPIPFRLPCNVAGVEKAIRRDDKKGRAPRTKEHFQAVAWAIVRDWVAAQMALIEAEQASLAQVFLPYCVVQEAPGGQLVTAFDQFMLDVSKQKRLGGGDAAKTG